MLGLLDPRSHVFDYMVKDTVNGYNILNNYELPKVNELVNALICKYYTRCIYGEYSRQQKLLTGPLYYELVSVKWQRHVYDLMDRNK